MIPLTVGSLFSGIGGFEFGLERTGGFKTVRQCEIDPFCLKVLEKHWPGVKRFADIKKMGIGEEIPYVDVICGGFPCQDISCAGKGAGIHAERSGLWWEMLRTVRLVRPKFVLVENVAALLNRGLDEVLGSLAESGYDAEWQVLSAKMFGGLHQRERTFVVAYPAGMSCNGSQDDDNLQSIRPTLWCIKPGRQVNFESIGSKTEPGRIIHESSMGGMANGLPRRLHINRLHALGNAIVPQCAEYVGRCVLAAEGHT